MDMADVAVFTLGCKVNQAESDELKAGLEKEGHRIVSDAAAADLCVVNTCTVTSESDRKSRKLIRMLRRRGASRIVAAGCYAETSPEVLEGFPGVVCVLPNSRKEGWLAEVLSLLPEAEDAVEKAWPRRARAFVKVQDGCERNCSYCIVPRARGRERSRPVDQVLEAVSSYTRAGTSEVVLCGVNLGRYEMGDGKDLAYLVRQIISAGGGYRIRLSSIELEDLRPAWIDEWSANSRVCPHLHLPLQSGDEDILRDMGRAYGPDDFLSAAEMLHRVWPGATLTTEVIAGYPGEADESFRHTVELLKRARPSRVHVFRFSERPGTRAWGRGDAIEKGKIAERSAELREVAEALRLGYIEERRGEICDMLVERWKETDGAARAYGTTEDFIKGTMYAEHRDCPEGKIVTAEICGVLEGRALLKRRGGE